MPMTRGKNRREQRNVWWSWFAQPRPSRSWRAFCTRAARRVDAALDQIEANDDERMVAIAKLAYKRGEYGYAFFED